MIGHRDELVIVQRHIEAYLRRGKLFLAHDMAVFVQMHVLMHYLTQQTLPLVGADGDEICAGLGVVVLRQAHGTTMVALPCHRVGRYDC
jgi:hypothetical protein